MVQDVSREELVLTIGEGPRVTRIGRFLLYASDSNIFNSPDENATFVFSQNFADQGDFFIEREVGLDPLVRPRSTNIYQDKLVPGFFLEKLCPMGFMAG